MRTRDTLLGITKNERGVTMVESAIALPMLLIILIATFDLLRISYNLLTVQYVTARVMRDAVLGDLSAGDVRRSVRTRAGAFGVDVENRHISLCPIDRIPCSGVNPGSAQELMVLDVNVPTNGFVLGPAALGLSRATFRLSATTVGRMEPEL